MLTDQKNLPKSRVKLTITGNAAQFQHAFEHELEHASEGVSVPGFRPGNAPKNKILERIGRPRIEAGALDHLIQDTYIEALQEAKLNPVSPPKVEVTKYETPAEDAADDTVVVTYTVETDVMPEIDVKGYEKIRIKKKEEPLNEGDEVKKVIDYLRKQRANLVVAPEGAVLAEGMWTDIGYEGSVDGVKREDMKNEHHPLVLGEGSLIPGFEEELTGMKVGESKAFKITFPKDYQAKELSGKKAEFSVTVHEIKNVELPEVDKKFAKNFGHDSVNALEKAIAKNVQEEKQAESRQKIEEEVLEELVKLAKFELPASLVEQELERAYVESRQRLEKVGFDWNTYLDQVKKTAEEVREEMRPQAERNVRIGLMLGQILEEEKIEGNDGRKAVDRLVEIATA